MNKKSVFFLTFFTYAIVHMMRTTYSFNKHKFQQIFGINDLYLGFLDSLLYITLAIGTFNRYTILNSLKPVETCLYTAIPAVIGFSIIPMLSIFKDPQTYGNASIFIYILITLSICMFGFFQLAFFPATLTIFSYSFNVKDHGILVGIWSSKSNVGNIFGFFLGTLLVYKIEISWQWTMIICSFLFLVVCWLLYKYVQNPQFKNQNQITTPQFFQFLSRTWKQTEFKLYIISFSLFKAILYSYQLWTPKFLIETGYKQFSGYVPMLFDVSTLFGSYAMGYIYHKQQNQNLQLRSNYYFFMKYKFFIPSILVTLICLCYVFLPGSLGLYFLLGALMGLFLGAIYNSLQNNEILRYTNNSPDRADMFSTINIGFGCLLVGICQFLIGFILNLGDSYNQVHNEDQFIQKGQIYIVIALIGIVASIMTYMRTNYKHVEATSDSDIDQPIIGRSQNIKHFMLGSQVDIEFSMKDSTGLSSKEKQNQQKLIQIQMVKMAKT